MFSFLNWSSIIKDSCFHNNLPSAAVTIAILKYASFHSWRCLMNRNDKSFKQIVFLLEQCAVSKVTTSVRSAFFCPWHRPTIILPLVYCPVDNTLFEVSPLSPELCCLDVSSHYCCYGNHAADSKPLKTFYAVNWELNKVSLWQK